MKIKEAKVNYGRTVNIGNFESLRIDVEFSASLGDNENHAEATESLYKMAKEQVKKMINGKIQGDITTLGELEKKIKNEDIPY